MEPGSAGRHARAIKTETTRYSCRSRCDRLNAGVGRPLRFCKRVLEFIEPFRSMIESVASKVQPLWLQKGSGLYVFRDLIILSRLHMSRESEWAAPQEQPTT